GFRFTDPNRGLIPDDFARLYDRQGHFGVGADRTANPEFRLRGALLKHETFELALEGRVWLPFEDGTRFGGMFGVPMAIHIKDAVRFDTGVFIPIIFRPDPGPTFYAISIPFHVWFQVTQKVWLGPMTGLVFNHYGNPRGDQTDLQLGFGLGVQLARAIDFK